MGQEPGKRLPCSWGCAEYHWEELWRALFALLEFTSSRLDNFKVLGRVEEMVEEVRIVDERGMPINLNLGRCS